MKTINILPSKRVWTVLGLILVVAVFSTVAEVWKVAHAKPHVVSTRVQPVQPQATNKHFNGKVQFDILAKLLADDRRASGDEWMKELADPNAGFRLKTQNHPLLSRPAPDFMLVDQHDQQVHFRERYKQGPIVLVFYLGYSCNFCVHDLCELNADIERFHSLGGDVIAVSGDSPEVTRQRFQQFGAFNFTMLYDPGHVVAQSYGMYRPASSSGPEQLIHGTFLIGRDEQVDWVHYGDTPVHNDMALLYELARLENKLPSSELTLQVDRKEPTTP